MVKQVCATWTIVALLASVLVGALAAAPPAAAQQQDTILFAETNAELRGPTVSDINEEGQIVGSIRDGDEHTLFIRANDGTLTLFDPPGSAFAPVAAAINNVGQVAGHFNDSGDNKVGFIRSADGTFVTFTVPQSGSGPVVADINNHGEVTGTASGRAFVRTADGNAVLLELPNAVAANAVAINDSGQIAGSFHDDMRTSGFIRSATGTVTIVDVPGSTSTRVVAMNDHGEVAGWYNTSGNLGHINFRFFVRSPAGAFTTFSVSNSSASIADINNRGDVVGRASQSLSIVGFVRSADSTITILRPGVSTYPSAINDAGHVTGSLNTDATYPEALHAGFVIPDAASPGPSEPGHTVAANQAGDVVFVALKEDGRLYTRRSAPGAEFGQWHQLGAGSWASADVTIDEAGRASFVAVKADGRLYTTAGVPDGSFESWVQHELPTWSTDSQPSIATNGPITVLAAVKTDGRLLTRQQTNGTWGELTEHGLSTWAHVDVAMANDGDIWLAGTKRDGRLYIRSHLGVQWSAFERQGLPTWSTTTPPSISATDRSAIFAAVKTDGRLYTRRQTDDIEFGISWEPFVRQGRDMWTSASIAMTDSTTILAATKQNGVLFTRLHDGTAWQSFTPHGRGSWSATADPSVAINQGDKPVLLAAKWTGVLYTQTHSGTAWDPIFTDHGRPTWAN